MQWIPELSWLENGEYFRENTIIYDKDGNEIYSIFKDGKRTYIPYWDISPTIIDWVTSIEDKTFFENPWIDVLGLLRVGVSYVTQGKIWGRIGGASTISQQLIKNTLLTNERSIKRKIQEAYLSYTMNSTYSKEKILEMYLNTISFWHNANGVEQASRTFFGKSAKDVWALGSTILASIINAPTRYSPYLHRDRLMGKLEIYPSTDPENRIIITTQEDKKTYNALYKEFQSYLSGITVSAIDTKVHICGIKKEYINEQFEWRELFFPDEEWCIDTQFDNLDTFFGNIRFAQELTIKDTTDQYVIEYTTWRKDAVARRMFEDGKIDGSTYKSIIYDGIDFEFKKYVENIKYPHFVMHVKDYLETKYGKDLDITSGLKIYTTIDPRLQDKAEEIIKKQVEINKKLYSTPNAALVSMNNVDWKILTWVWWVNYFDTENKWENDMIISDSIRPGSSFKPFVYAMAIAKHPIGWESPVADVDTKFWGWNPDNYDGKFNGIMMVKNALNYSRNIPAAKMYFLAGGQDEIVDGMRSMWVTTLQKEKEQEKAWKWTYGAPLSLWTAEIPPVELMQAYSVFANNWVKKDVYFIEKIETTDGTIIEEHKATEWIQVFSPAASYIINKMISDNSARPESSYWRNALTINGKNVAAKTGTADGKTKNGTKFPRDLWTAWYSPQITTVVWAGDTDGKLLGKNAESLNSAAPIWKAYMEFALKDIPKTDWKKPEWIYTYNIVKTSWKLATKNTPESQIISTIMAVKLEEFDDWVKEIEIDTFCNGKVTDETPIDAIQTLYIPAWKPVIDGYDPDWTSSFYATLKRWSSWSLLSENKEYTDTPCERTSKEWSVNISIIKTDSSTVSINFLGDRMIQKIIIAPEGWEETTVNYGTGTKKSGTETIKIWNNKTSIITVSVIDIYGYRYTNKNTPTEWGSENIPNNNDVIGTGSAPVITLTNPKSKNLNLYNGDPFNLRFNVQTSTSAREIQVLVDGVPVQVATSGEVFVFPMSSIWLEVWKHLVQVIAVDANFQKSEASFTLTIIPR
jgi:penicillin-binding protein 1A